MRRLMVSFLGMALAFVLLEVSLRIADRSWPSFYRPDSEIGWTLRPEAEGWWNLERRQWIRISAQGLRDRLHAVPKPPGVFRILLLGDSFGEALQVPIEATFWKVMESNLAAAFAETETRVEVVNFSASGYGTVQELLALRKFGEHYQPDLVLLAVTTGNDIMDNSRVLSGRADRPYATPGDSGLVFDASFRTRAAFRFKTSVFGRGAAWLLGHLRLLQWLNEIKNRLWYGGALAGPSFAGEPLYRPDPLEPVWTEAWKITGAAISEIASEAERLGARLLVCSLSNGIQVHPDGRLRAEFQRRERLSDLFEPERRLERICRDRGVPFLALAPELLGRAEESGAPLHGFASVGDGTAEARLGEGHWNEQGHRLAGEILAREVSKILGGR